jgi:hypothetical protein
MAKPPSKFLLRLLGAGVFAVGAWVGSVGLDQHAERMGGPQSSWRERTAEIIDVEPHPQYENRVIQLYAIEMPDSEVAQCPVTDRPDEAGAVGDEVRIWVDDSTRTGACRITLENWDAGFTPAHFFMIFAALWMAMGAAFMIRPPRNAGVGGSGGL